MNFEPLIPEQLTWAEQSGDDSQCQVSAMCAGRDIQLRAVFTRQVKHWSGRVGCASRRHRRLTTPQHSHAAFPL